MSRTEPTESEREPATRPRLQPQVLLVGLASLFNDASSEMIYPLLPIFLTAYVGATPLIAGLIEGSADALSSILKLFAGSWSDRFRRRKPMIVAGYAMAAVSRFFIAGAVQWPTVLGARLLDRTGKGIRSAPRDALIADVTPPAHRGRAFGLQRSLDHTGAVIGPLLAAVLLGFFHLPLRTMFFLAAFPAMIGVVLLMVALREPPRSEEALSIAPIKTSTLAVPPSLRLPLLSLALFYLANSSDIFLLLRARDVGVPLAMLPLLWSAHHVLKALFTFRFGSLSDRVGRKWLLVTGWITYGAIYLLFPLAQSLAAFTALFLLYAIPFFLTEGAERAWISEVGGAALQGRTFGFYYVVVGLSTFAGTALFGWLYQSVSPSSAFFTGASLAGVAALTVLLQKEPSRLA